MKDFIVSGIFASFIMIALCPIANGYGNAESKTPKRGRRVCLLCFPWSIAMVAVDNNLQKLNSNTFLTITTTAEKRRPFSLSSSILSLFAASSLFFTHQQCPQKFPRLKRNRAWIHLFCGSILYYYCPLLFYSNMYAETPTSPAGGQTEKRTDS